MNLPRRRGLSQIEASGGACNTVVVGDCDERAQKSKVHRKLFRILIDNQTINELDRSMVLTILPTCAYQRPALGRDNDKPSPPPFSASGRRRCPPAGRIPNRAGASLSIAAGTHRR